MKVLGQSNVTSIVVVETTVQHDDTNVYIVKDYYDASSKIIDTQVVTKDGYAVEDPALVEELLSFIDESSVIISDMKVR